jgi:hypothetical protein
MEMLKYLIQLGLKPTTYHRTHANHYTSAVGRGVGKNRTVL